MARTFLIRTFGCQMNEHDSERLAGLLVADGLEPTDDLEDADVVVFNTCCIRENADNKLYGHLGQLKALQDRRPGHADRRGRLPGPEGPGAGPPAGRPRRRGLRHPQPGPGPRAAAPGRGRAARSSRSSTPPTPTAPPDHPPALSAVRELPYAAWVTIQTGCDNSCAFCIVPSVRGPEVSRPFDDIVAEVAGLAAPGRDRGHPARPERELLRPRPDPAAGRSSPTCCGPWARSTGIRRVRFTSPHPKDLRPETIAAMAETPAVCEQLHLPLQSGSDRVLAAMRRGYTAERYLDRLAAARAGDRRPGRHHRHHRRLPRRDRRRLRAHPGGGGRGRATTAPTPSSSRPGPGPGRRPWPTTSCPPSVVAERFERLRVVVERSALARHQARIGRTEEVLVEGPSRRDPAVRHRPHPPGQAGPLRPAGRRRPPAAGACADGAWSPGPPPTTCAGELVRGHRPAPAPHAASRSPSG